MKKKVVIVEDENLAIEEMKFLLKEYQELEIAGIANNAESAIELINTLQPDLIFLDIQLRTTNAFEILEHLQTNAHIIFATAYDEYALRAFEINALDYLLKPIHPERLKVAIARFFKNTPLEEPLKKCYNYNDKIIINIRDGYKMINISDIKAITADGDYSYLILGSKKKHILIKSLKEWETILPNEHFIRIHRSTIINVGNIRHIEKWFSNTCRIYLEGLDTPFEMSQRYTSAFKKYYQA
jgi:two-component system, LytTR family, response regulator